MSILWCGGCGLRLGFGLLAISGWGRRNQFSCRLSDGGTGEGRDTDEYQQCIPEAGGTDAGATEVLRQRLVPYLKKNLKKTDPKKRKK